MRKKAACRTASYRPATRHRRNRHDELVAVDLFSGFGGLTEAIRRAGFLTIMAANHNLYKVLVHEENHPEAEHWVADLVDPESGDYHDVRDLPAADLLVAGVSCVNHSMANTKKAYAQGATLFDYDDPEFEARVTRSERDRATANCVLHYAERHHPRMILVECTTELTSWGPALPGRSKVGDGTTYRWWLRQFKKLDYDHKVLYLNAMFFGVGQSRDRLFIAFWDKSIPAPDLDHRPISWCGNCHDAVEARWTWKTGIPPSGRVAYGKQYNYTCPRCRREVVPPMTPSLGILDLTDLGARIGDRREPLAPATMARAERCRQRFGEFPAILMPAKAVHGIERHPWQPMSTQTSQRETALLSTAALMAAAGHTFERPGSECRTRGADQPLWAQTGTNATGLIAPPVALAGQVFAAHRHNGDEQPISRPMDTVTTTHEKALLVAVNNFQGVPRGVDTPLPTQLGSETLSLVSGGILPFRKHTTPTVHGEPMPTVTSDQIPGLVTAAVASDAPNDSWISQWRDMLADLALEDCHFRMLRSYEVGRGCGFDTSYPGKEQGTFAHKGTFKVWGSERDQVNGFGNAVPPPMGEWIAQRLRAALHGRSS